jgi:outer membrane lipoprotein carrier protein
LFLFCRCFRKFSLEQFGSYFLIIFLFNLAALFLWHLPALANGDSSQSFLEQFQEKRTKINTFTADFVQKKTLPLFDEEKISTGTVIFKTPYQMIWKYQTPDKTQMKVTNESVSFYFPSLEQIEVYRMNKSKGAAPFFFAFEATADEIRDNFTLAGPVASDGMKQVELTPKTEPLASQVTTVVLWLDESDYLPRKILINEITGDTTEISFSNIKVNQPVADEQLQFDAPEGTEVIEENSDF